MARSLSRRRLLRASFWGALALSAAGAGGFALDYLWPRLESVVFWVGRVEDYPPGGPPHVFYPDRRDAGVSFFARDAAVRAFWVVRLDPRDRSAHGSAGAEGFLALSARCTHLGCMVPWREQFEFDGMRGWFRCPCHDATYTRTGLRVYGPAPRSLDTLPITIDARGDIWVDASTVRVGGTDNPSRAVRPPNRASTARR